MRSFPGADEAAWLNERSGGGGELDDHAGPAVTASRKSAVSATVWLMQPFTDIPLQCSVSIGTRFRCGFNPNRPVWAAGYRIDPAPSEA